MKILWAVDPFVESPSVPLAAIRALAALSQGRDCEIQPTYIYDSGALAKAAVPTSVIKTIHTTGEESLAKIVDSAGVRLPGLKPIKALGVRSFSLRTGALELIELARRTRADLILVATRGHTGPKRWLMGSFAETLLLHSDLPVLTVNPLWKGSLNLKNILFPTDFSAQSRKAFGHVVDLAKSFNAKITLYHKIHVEMTPALEAAMGVYAHYQNAVTADTKAFNTEAERWKKIARSQGVPATIHIDQNTAGTIADCILKRAQRTHDGLIALAGQSGPASATLFGSIARQVVRGAHEPVWIIHPSERTRLARS